MLSKMALLAKSRTLATSLNPTKTYFKSITTFTFLSQEPQLDDPPSPSTQPPPPPPLPPNPASGSPLYNDKNWRNPVSNAQALVPVGFPNQWSATRHQSMSPAVDCASLMNAFADLMTFRNWDEIKQLFESWIRSLDSKGKPNKPDVNLYNHYLRANLMMGASPHDLLDMLTGMNEFGIEPNTASYNLVLKCMFQAKESLAATELLDRMLKLGKDSKPDGESFDLVVVLLFSEGKIDAAIKYIDLWLKSGYVISTKAFTECLTSCISKGKLDTLVWIIEKCKSSEQNKALCPSWLSCYYIADAAMQNDNSKLAFFALEFMARWIHNGENAQPPIFLSVNEGLVVSALATAGKTYSSKLVDASWAVLKRSLRQNRVANPETYLAKISAYSSLGDLQRAFITLSELQTVHGDSNSEEDDLYSPFTSLHPLVVACSKKGFETLDSVYYQLENLSQADPPFKSVAALNCVIMGCANTWDLDRAYQTFEAISSSFGLTPNIHSYNALMCAFSKLKKTIEASGVLEHLISLGVKPNATSYTLLVDAHLINRDPKAALSVVNNMVEAGFVPTRQMLRKIRRRSIRESDFESDDQVTSMAREHNIYMGSENRRNMLFNLEYSTQYA